MSLFRFFRKKIFKNYTELYLKCDRRLSSKLDLEIMELTAKYGTEKKIAFSNYFYQRKRSIILFKEYYNQKIITSTEYLFSISYLLIVPILRTIKKFLFITDFEIDVIKKFNYNSKILTFTAGVKRLFPPLYGYQIEEIKVVKQKYSPTLKERFLIFFYCVFYNVYNYSLMLQYYSLEKELRLIDFNRKEVIVEEGRNPTQICFLDYAEKNDVIVTVSYRGIPLISRYYFGFNIVTTNKISYEKLSKYNANVKIIEKPYLIDFKKIVTKDKKNKKVGFLTELNGSGITSYEKTRLDLFINKVSEKFNIRVSISAHPQERKKTDYYNATFTGNFIEYRKDKMLEHYLNNIDILIGRSSTAIFQSFLAKTPVIILDLFSDKPMKELAKLSEGLIKYATDEKSFLKYYKYFYEMKNIEIETRYCKAISNLDIESTF